MTKLEIVTNIFIKILQNLHNIDNVRELAKEGLEEINKNENDN